MARDARRLRESTAPDPWDKLERKRFTTVVHFDTTPNGEECRLVRNGRQYFFANMVAEDQPVAVRPIWLLDSLRRFADLNEQTPGWSGGLTAEVSAWLRAAPKGIRSARPRSAQ